MDTLLLNADGQPLSHVPLSVVSWQVAMRLLVTEKVRVLKEYDDWVVRSQLIEWKVPSIIMMTNQKKWNKGLKYSRSNVYLRDDHTCQLQTTWRCKELHGKVKLQELTLDHVVPRSHGGKTNWLNVCTSCKACNSEKGNDHTILPKKKPYKPTYFEILNKRKKMPIYIRDPEWAYYIDWPEDMVNVVPHQQGATPSIPGEHFSLGDKDL